MLTFLTVLVMGLMLSPVASAAQNCTVYLKSFAFCEPLNELGSSLAWNFFTQNRTLEIAFTEDALTTKGWVGWGINPTSSGKMVGSQALVAFSNGSWQVMTYSLTSALVTSNQVLLPGKVSLNYTDYSAQATGTNVTIFATLQLQPNESLTLLNHVWNRGSGVNLITYQPTPHVQSGDNYASFGTFGVLSGAIGTLGGVHLRLKENHGIIAAVSWGILLPIGFMAARYLRPFKFADPLWFYLHVICQLTGYVGGVVAWAMGLKLLHYASRPLLYPKHRNLGMAIFVLGTLQVLAVVLRPKKDQKIRPYWNVYHHMIGYATILIIIINIFEGFHALQPNHKWRKAYIIFLIILGAICIVLELVTWIIWFHRRKLVTHKKLDDPEIEGNGQMHSNGMQSQYKMGDERMTSL